MILLRSVAENFFKHKGTKHTGKHQIRLQLRAVKKSDYLHINIGERSFGVVKKIIPKFFKIGRKKVPISTFVLIVQIIKSPN